MRNRAFDMLVGALIGVLVTGASSMYVVGSRVAALEVEVRFLRKDVDRVLTGKTGTLDSSLQENAGNIVQARATGQYR